MRFRCLLVCALVAFSASASASAQSVDSFYRGSSIRLVIGVAAGGSYDIDARLVARHLGDHIPGNPKVLPENMPGASGRLAANYLYTVAAKDGSVLGAVQETAALGQLLGENGVRYDAAGFNWVGTPVQPDDVIAVRADAGVHSIAEAKVKELVIGATSPTGGNYIYPALVNRLVGTKFKIVTGYQGGNAIDLALERGEVQGRGSNPWSAWKATRPDWVRTGWLIPLVQVTLIKHPDLPNVPRLIDLAPDEAARGVLQTMSLVADIGRPIFLPPGVPSDRVAALRRAFDETMTDPAFLADAARLQEEVRPASGAALATLVREVLATPKPTVERLKAALAVVGAAGEKAPPK